MVTHSGESGGSGVSASVTDLIVCTLETCIYLVASLYPAKNNLNRTSSYPHYSDVLRTEGFQLPMLFKDIPKFEKANDVSVNVFEWGGKQERCQRLHLTSRKREKHVNLLLIHDSENLRNHYLCIRNLSCLVSSQISTQLNKYICDRCLQYFRSQEKLNIREIDCSRMNECALKLLTEDDKWLKFKNYAYKEPTQFVIYADLESMLETQRDQGHGAYCRYQHHHAFSVGYYLHCRYDSSLSEYRAYRDEKGCIVWFASKLHELSCAYRGPVHSRCNLSYQSSYVIPVVFHNLSGYDTHFFIKELANAFEGKIDALPLTKEKYISFTKHTKRNNDVIKKSWKKCIKFRFIDSFKFLNSSLDKLSSYLDKSDLRIVRSQFNRLSNDDFHLLTRKGVFPYDYVTTCNKLSDTCLSPREAFYNQLCDSEISDVDYCHANEVWSRFGIQTLGQYSDLDLKLDVLLLANVFENFREKSLENYKLDPAHYYTLPGFACDAMLKLTKVELELFTDVDMLLFVERGIRVDLNTRFRTNANNDFSKNLLKLMNNAVFGKTMENVRNHVNVMLLSQWSGRHVQMNQLPIEFYKPIYIGMSVLDISKLNLYDFHCGYMLPNFQERCRILYMDTDSLTYQIICDDAYEMIKRDIHRYDTSNYDRNNVYSTSMKRTFQQSQPQSQQKQLQIPRNVRILGRRYPIAGNYFKFLEIFVRVDENLRVEFVLGDNHGTEISFSMTTWKQLVKTRDYIHSYLDTDKKEKQIHETLSLQIVNFNGMSLIKLFDSQASIYVTKETMDNLYKLEL
ncbi:uncharacterized protein LOC117225171 [Megalopta genalis]|uniref:uncharacterized protein LOC117225171 n=1 Tax=Megalopta genalis TaxID=115081 RepID=UPI003FD0D35C